MKDCIFCKIRDKVISKEFTYEDEDVMVFPDIHPLKSIHLLIIPKKHVSDFVDLQDADLTVKLREVVQKMVKKEKLQNRGYRVVINGGGAQVVKHLHIHLIGPLSSTEEM